VKDQKYVRGIYHMTICILASTCCFFVEGPFLGGFLAVSFVSMLAWLSNVESVQDEYLNEESIQTDENEKER